MLFIPSLNMSAICFFCFIVAVFFICSFMLLIGFLLGGRSVSSYSKNVPFESGIDSIGNARLRFSIKFYLVGMFFVVFDAEALYLYIWSIVIRESGWFGLIEILIFICFLLLGLIYLIDMDALQWKNSRFLNNRK